ncbi:MAG: 2,3-bisphosphoglycerate-independent phosphoglycerate mutase [Syntrophomonadaceae bacterium]|nr:2,3-bisphosphoglycerate-independent phosphoglycerate mutase [Syntrophomonadaceae bacterium]
MPEHPVVLMILDGWGCRESAADNAISLADPVKFESLKNTYPYTELACSGRAVGLPAGQMGNSEVGHLNIGAGRVVFQEITRIDQAIEDGSFFGNAQLLAAIEKARAAGGKVHLMGLLSDGGVHSSLNHLYALLRLCRDRHMERVYVHGFLDGRDVPPQSALEYVGELEKYMADLGIGEIATLGGRYYGMDRDNRWDRIARAYYAAVLGEGPRFNSAAQAIEASYAAGVTDEFMEPVVLIDSRGNPRAAIENGDSVIFFNFRADRARQICHSLVDEDIVRFERRCHPLVQLVCMTQYDIDLKAPVAFMPQNLDHTLGQVLAAKGLKQLRIAETEKYAHLTFFFNGGIEEANPGEERILIPSPQVSTYDLQPEMSARLITDRVLAEIDRDYYDVVFINYANGDMVGHTGILEAAIAAIKTLDECIGRVADRVLAKKGFMIITADHGNAERMLDPDTRQPFTAHTTSRVPFILVGEAFRGFELRPGGALCDIAPTLLSLMGIEVPAEMTGQDLTRL